MKRLFLSKTLHIVKQSYSQAKNRLDHLKILNDLIKDQKNIDLHSTDSLLIKSSINQMASKNLSQQSYKMQQKKASLFNKLENYLERSRMLKLLLKNPKINLSSSDQKFQEVLKSTKILQENELSRTRWIRHLILILFLTKILQQQNIRCDYDINDMMVTIELQQRLLSEQQQNEKHDQEERQKTSNNKSQNKRNSIKFKGPTKDQRYGTAQEMLKHQMQSSEDFGSVQERMLFKERQVNRNKQASAKGIQIVQKKTVEESQQKVNDENIADVVFRQQTQQQQSNAMVQQKKPQNLQQNTVEQEKKQHIGQTLPSFVVEQQINDPSQINLEQNKQNSAFVNVSQELGNAEQKNVQSNIENSQQVHEKLQQQSTNIVIQQEPKFEQTQISQKSSNIQNQPVNNQQPLPSQIPINQLLQNKQNHATIQIPSADLLSLSKSIQNFLKIRGISVDVLNKNSEKVQNDQKQTFIKLNLCNKLMDCKEMNIQKQTFQKRDIFHHINNLLNPPHIISSIEQAKQLLKTIQKDENIVGSYIPQHQSFEKSKQSTSNFDTFSTRYPQTDPVTAEKQFRQYKYLSSSKKNCFVIIRDKQVANYMKISTSKIGLPHLIYKYDKQLNGKQSEPNCKIDGEFYHMVGNLDKFIEKQKLNTTEKVAQKINTLTQRGFTLINNVEDMYDKIRQLKQQSVSFFFDEKNQLPKNQQKKLFVIKINDPKSQNEINAILQKLSKMNKNEVSIVKTQSQLLLKSLGVFSNEQYGTIRLFDLQNRQEPIVKQNDKQSTKGHFERYVPNVPFQVESLSRWISNITPFEKPYEEFDRSVNKLKPSHPGDFEKMTQQGKVKLVLFYKQGCKGCKMMQDLLSRIVQLKQRLKQNDSQAAKRLRREICLRYRIQNPQHLTNLQISKFNILNDDQSIQVPQTTPTVYMFNETNKQKVLLKTDQIFGHLNRINTNNGQVVQDHMVRDLIEQIQKGNKRFESLY